MPLNTAEYYDPKVGKWTEISRMNQCRFGVGCAVLHDMVYAVGGTDGTNLKTVERYDPEFNTWTMVASMSTARFVPLCVRITYKTPVNQQRMKEQLSSFPKNGR